MTGTKKNTATFTEVEKEAMRARARELAAEARLSKNREAGERDVQEAIAALDGKDKELAAKIHKIVTETAPELMPRTWYGMPAYSRDGKVVCFFQAAKKFESRYASFGFNDTANIDDGNMWATAFALQKLTASEEKKIAELVKKAVS